MKCQKFLRSKIMTIIYHSYLFAFLLGFYQMLRYQSAIGCPCHTDEAWNSSYDRGANFAERLTG